MLMTIAQPARAVLLAMALATPGCSTISGFFGGESRPEGVVGHVEGFIGAVVADEPQAVLAARQVLAAGGNAADAAVALGLALSVTLPSRVGLGSGGACLVHNGDAKASGVPSSIVFLPQGPADPTGADRPAAAPMLARGLFLLSARYGRARFETQLVQAEILAREGVPASRAFTRDLAVVGGALAADGPARQVFYPGGRAIAEGETLKQPDLAGTLAQIRHAGVGDLYQGTLARRVLDGAALAGAGLTQTDLKAALPKEMPAITIDLGGDGTAAFLPLPADGGLAAAAAFQALQAGAASEAGSRALAAAAQFRRSGGDAMAILAARATTGSLPALPASTSFAAVDREGNAVVCAVSMGNLFGTGRMLPDTGMLLAASPARFPPPLYAAGMITNRRTSGLIGLAGGSGQEGAALAVAAALSRAASGAAIEPAGAPEPGRTNVISCGGASGPKNCAWSTDPRGYGLAAGAN